MSSKGRTMHRSRLLWLCEWSSLSLIKRSRKTKPSWRAVPSTGPMSMISQLRSRLEWVQQRCLSTREPWSWEMTNAQLTARRSTQLRRSKVTCSGAWDKLRNYWWHWTQRAMQNRSDSLRERRTMTDSGNIDEGREPCPQDQTDARNKLSLPPMCACLETGKYLFQTMPYPFACCVVAPWILTTHARRLDELVDFPLFTDRTDLDCLESHHRELHGRLRSDFDIHPFPNDSSLSFLPDLSRESGSPYVDENVIRVRNCMVGGDRAKLNDVDGNILHDVCIEADRNSHDVGTITMSSYIRCVFR